MNPGTRPAPYFFLFFAHLFGPMALRPVSAAVRLWSVVCRTFTTAAAPSSSSLSATDALLAPVKAWRSGKALVDLRDTLLVERPEAQRKRYDRFLTEYALYDGAPSAVVHFWFANKPAPVPRSVLHFNVLVHTKAFVDRDVDAAVRIVARMQQDGVAPDETTYQFLIGALGAAGRPADAAAQFETMVKSGLLPTVHHYQLLIMAFAQHGDVAGAEGWATRLKKDKEAIPSLTASTALLTMYAKQPATAAKGHAARVAELTANVERVRAAESQTSPKEPEGVQWSMKFKAVTSTGGDDKGAAAKGGAPAKPAAKPAAKK
jgi:hypothetical protein